MSIADATFFGRQAGKAVAAARTSGRLCKARHFLLQSDGVNLRALH